ncbi:MAG: putative Ig domain-containing protein [Polyangiaceae bacterium]|nr:putative Ig domain-containing protein [Polyangiaceae bacterium]
MDTLAKQIGLGANAVGVALTPNNNYIYVTFIGVHTGTMDVINTTTYNTECSAVLDRWDSGGVVAGKNGVYAYATGNKDGHNELTTIATYAYIVESRTNTGGSYGNGPFFGRSLAITPDGNYIYAANPGSNTVSVFAIRAGALTPVCAPIGTGIGPTPLGLAASPDGRYVYVTNSGGNTVSVIATPSSLNPSTNQNKVVNSFPSGGNSPWGIAITADGQYAYVANSGSNTVGVIRLDMSESTRTIAVGPQPKGVAITPDQKYVCVTNSGNATLSVISRASNTVVNTIPCGGADIAMASDSRAYVADTNNRVNVVALDVPPTIWSTYFVSRARLGAKYCFTDSFGTTANVFIETKGTPKPSFVLFSGGLPPGLSFVETSGSADTVSYGLAGTPTKSGSYSFTMKAINNAHNDVSANPSQTYTIDVLDPPVILGANLPDGKVGVPYLPTAGGEIPIPCGIVATGYPAPTFKVTAGSLPPGLSLDSATGVISGTPTTGGSYTFTVTATNSAGSDSKTFTIAVNAAPVITGAYLPDGEVGAPYLRAGIGGAQASCVIMVTGYPTPSLKVTAGSLPPGLSLDPATGVISGTPITGGSYSFTVTASNSVGSTSKTYTITVNAVPVITTTSLPGAVAGTAYTGTGGAAVVITATGYPDAPTVAVTAGSLPPGLSLNPTTRVISGTPTTGGSYTFTVTASNSVGHDSKTFTIMVNAAPVITTTSLPGAVAGTAYTGTGGAAVVIMTTGYPAPTFAVTTGSLPPGLSLNPTTGVISGTPTTGGSYTFTVTASNSVGHDSKTFAIVVNAAPVITTTSLPDATAGAVYGIPSVTKPLAPVGGADNVVAKSSLQSLGTVISADDVVARPPLEPFVPPTLLRKVVITATGYPAPTFAVTAGSLPPGLELSETGVISGTPTDSGSYSFTVTASNSVGHDSKTFTIAVNAAPVITTAGLPDAMAGAAYLARPFTKPLDPVVSADNVVEKTSVQPLTPEIITPPVLLRNVVIRATGYPAPTFAVTAGSLPPGLELSETGVISGTPTDSGSYSFTVTASNSFGSDSKAFTIQVFAAPVITTDSLPDASVGVAYGASSSLKPLDTIAGTDDRVVTPLQPLTPGVINPPILPRSRGVVITTTGYPVPVFEVSGGTMPPGLELSETGVISGTPTNAGSYTFAVTATNSVGQDERKFAIQVLGMSK